MKLWDPYAKVHGDNPYPMYDRLREEAPVYKSQSGDFIVTGYNEVKSILLNAEIFRVGNRFEWINRQVKYLENKDENLTAITEAMNSFLVQMNPPDHTILRKLIIDAWDNKVVDKIILQNIDDLLGSTKKDFDLVKEFASPLPVLTMSKIMGLPKEDYQELKELTTDLLKCLDMYTSFKTLVQINKAAKSLMEYFDSYIDYRETNLSDDLTSKIILLARTRNIQLSRKQLISVCIFLFMAGEETTINLIGTGTYHLINNKPELESIMADARLWDIAVDEVLRFESPVNLVGRIANTDFSINGVQIKKEDTITLCIGAANRDPSVFPSPELLQINRHPKHHLAFGAGVHFCLGSWLARHQWKLAMRELFNRFPQLKQSGEHKWNPMLSIRGLSSLPVTA